MTKSKHAPQTDFPLCVCSVFAQPRHVTFVVVDDDEESGQSLPAIVMINFESIDNPPILDLNGAQEPGRDYFTTFLEESDSIMVCSNSQ